METRKEYGVLVCHWARRGAAFQPVCGSVPERPVPCYPVKAPAPT